MQALVAAQGSDDPVEIEHLCKALANATESFAAARMNRGIAQALAGKNIASI
jgi:molecular chaperone HscA